MGGQLPKQAFREFSTVLSMLRVADYKGIAALSPLPKCDDICEFRVYPEATKRVGGKATAMNRLTRVKLTNFTAFASFDHQLSPGITVIIGANGTGKTHLLKILYAACAITLGEGREFSFAQKLRNVFNPYEGRIGRLARRASTSINAGIQVEREGGKKLAIKFSNHTKSFDGVKPTGQEAWKNFALNSAYIPVKEMLAHAPGFLATMARRELSFEEVYPDIIKLAYLPVLKGPIDSARRGLLDALQDAIQGKVILKGEHFFLKNKQGDLEFTLLAEGIRKLALVWLLIQNGTLLAGSVLFWDEPEANLNPALMGRLVDVMLELHRLGVQIVLTTHNHVLLKEFDLRKKPRDSVEYLALFRGRDGSVQKNASDSFDSIDPNLISDTFDDLYDREVSRSLGISGT
jgi:ABC-type ATPase involved in cell division